MLEFYDWKNKKRITEKLTSTVLGHGGCADGDRAAYELYGHLGDGLVKDNERTLVVDHFVDYLAVKTVLKWTLDI